MRLAEKVCKLTKSSPMVSGNTIAGFAVVEANRMIFKEKTHMRSLC